MKRRRKESPAARYLLPAKTKVVIIPGTIGIQAGPVSVRELDCFQAAFPGTSQYTGIQRRIILNVAPVQKWIEDPMQVSACSSQKGVISVLCSGVPPVQCVDFAPFGDGAQKFWRQTVELCHVEAVEG